MTTVDNLLIEILNSSNKEFEKTMLSRDLKILKSLGKSILGNFFITENQSRLLVKILKENCGKISNFSEKIKASVDEPSWSKPFRKINVIKKFYISNNNDHTQVLNLEFTYSGQIRRILTENSKKIENLQSLYNGKIYQADLTEKNIVLLYELVKPYDFEIQETIINFYNTIKSWSKTEIFDQFLISNIANQNFQKSITNDLSISAPLDDELLFDRSVRYQYFLKKEKKSPETLTEKIAFREDAKIWIDKNQISLEEIFYSLKKLKRLPVLIVFDANNEKNCFEELKNLHNSLIKNEIFNNIGIYFRLPNNDIGTQFNKLIAENNYNCNLNLETKVVGVQNGKIPKFFIKNEWKPMSVISIGNSLRHTKTAVYANYCDLIITYTDQQPIIENTTLWE